MPWVLICRSGRFLTNSGRLLLRCFRVSGANVHDSQALLPLVMGIPAIRSRRGPRLRRPGRLRADKAYHSTDRLPWLHGRGIVPRIARPGIESSERAPEIRARAMEAAKILEMWP